MKETNEKGFGDRLDELMQAHPLYAGGRGQSALSKASGVPQPTISRILKKSAAPEMETVVKLALVFNVACEWLLTERGPKYIAELGSRNEQQPREFPVADSEEKLPEYVTKALRSVISAFHANVNPSIFDAFSLLLTELTDASGARMVAQNEETSPLTRAEKEIIDRSRGKTAEHLRGQQDAKHTAKRRQSS